MLGKGVPSITYGLRGLNYYEIELTALRAISTPAYMRRCSHPLTVLTNYSPNCMTKIPVPFPFL